MITHDHTTEFSYHGKLEKGEVHRVTLSAADHPLRLMVVHRDGIDPLWFDYTRHDGTPPSEDLTPGRKNSVAVLPGTMFTVEPDHSISQVVLTGTGSTEYSVMLIW